MKCTASSQFVIIQIFKNVMKRYHNISEVYCDVIYHDLDIILSYRSALITAAVKSLNMMESVFFSLCNTIYAALVLEKLFFILCEQWHVFLLFPLV